MSIADSVHNLINRYGSRLEISNGKDITAVRAFIQPLRYKNKMYIDGSFLPGGYIDGGHYLYIGSPEIRFDKGFEDVVITTADNESFIVKRAELYTLSDVPIYIWAILTPYAKEW